MTAAQNGEGPVLATPTPQEQNTNNAIVTDTGNAGKVRHPLSAAFGDLPADEFAELVADIKRNGQISDIVADDDGLILDGWHRYCACIEAGVIPRIEAMSNIVARAAETAGRTLTAAEFVVAQNARRRHLTAEQRRKIVAELLKADPDKSNRTIASIAKVDDKTVGTVRAKLEATAEIPQLTKTTGKDGKARTKPASKPAAKTPKAAAPAPPSSVVAPPVVPTICVDTDDIDDCDARIAAYEAEEAAERAALPDVQVGHVRLLEDALSEWEDDLLDLSDRIGRFARQAQRLGSAGCVDIEIDEIGDITFDMVELAKKIDEAVGKAESHTEHEYVEVSHD